MQFFEPGRHVAGTQVNRVRDAPGLGEKRTGDMSKRMEEDVVYYMAHAKDGQLDGVSTLITAR